MSSNETLIVAGATGYGVWPANSLEGARLCLAAPVDGIEIDVQMTADGHVVAHHDYWLARDATRLDGQWLEARGPALKTLTLEDLRRYDVGALKPGATYPQSYPHLTAMDGVRIPTLDELFAALKSPDGAKRWIYIEIKTDPQDREASPDPAEVTEAVIELTEAAGWADRTKVIAFDWKVLRLAKARNAEIATAHLTIPESLASSVRPLPNGDSPWADGCDPRHHGGSDLAAIKAHGGEEWSPYFTDVTPETIAEARITGSAHGAVGAIISGGYRPDDRTEASIGATVSGPAWGR